MDVKEFYSEVQQGNIAEYSLVHKFGRNDDIPNGSWAMVSPSSPSGTFPGSGVIVRIKADGDVADSASGAGAREITIIGIDTTLQEISETLVTSGTSASLLTTTSFWRIYRAYVSDIGTYGNANIDDIIIEDSDGVNDMLTIKADEGQTQHGAYSIPLGKIGYLLSVDITVDASKAADFRLFIRDNFTNTVSPISSKRLRFYWDGVLGQASYKPVAPGLILNALSDIWIEARGGGQNTEVSANFEILLKDDPSGPIRRI